MPNKKEASHKIILGFDFGMKYIGIAIGQSITETASALTTITARDGIPNWTEINLLIEQWRPTDLIVGIPLNMDGTEQPMTFCARRFMNRLHTRFKLPTHEVDERLSTWEAKNRQNEATLKSSSHQVRSNEKKIHAEAAVILIEQWMRDHSHST